MQAWCPFRNKCGTHSLWVGGTESAQTKDWRLLALLWSLFPGTSLVSLDCRGWLPWFGKSYACCIKWSNWFRKNSLGYPSLACWCRPFQGAGPPWIVYRVAEGLCSVLITPAPRPSMYSPGWRVSLYCWYRRVALIVRCPHYSLLSGWGFLSFVGEETFSRHWQGAKLPFWLTLEQEPCEICRTWPNVWKGRKG